MPERKGPESRWSSVRERERRERERAAEKERTRRARVEGEADPPASSLSDEERNTIRQSRFSSAETPPAANPSPDEPTPDAEGGQGGRGIGTRWRDSVPPPPNTPSNLPDLPGDSGPRRNRPGNSRIILFGVALFALMGVFAFLPFGPFGDSGSKPTPSPSATLPSILETPDGENPDTSNVATQQSTPETGQAIVCIDPGHGGWDTGWNRSNEEVTTGMGPYNPPHVTEAGINLGMAWMLKERLEGMGFFVVMTRESGAAVNMYEEDINGDGQRTGNITNGDDPEQVRARDELQARINVCNEANADVLISLHINGVEDTGVNGYEVIYTRERDFGQQNEELATLMYRQMDATLRDTDMAGEGRGPKADTAVDNQKYDYGSSSHIIMTGPDFEAGNITASQMPGITLECAFLSNDHDASWLVQPSNQQILVGAYALGIQQYFERYPPAG